MWRTFLRQPSLLVVAPCAASLLSRQDRGARCSEPDAEPEPRYAPSAPPLSALPAELPASSVQRFLSSAEGRSMIQAFIQKALREALNEELRKAKDDLRKACIMQEADFKAKVCKVADDAAHAAAASEVERLHKLIEAVASAEVRKETERVVPHVVREDPLMKRLLAENLEKMRKEVHAAAERELHEICNEDRYHRVNRTFLATLDQRCQKAVRDIEERAQVAIERAQRPNRFTQSMSFLAVILAGIAIALPMTK